MKLSIGRMSREEERRMLDRFIVDEPLETLKPVADAAEVLSLREECRKVFVHGDLRDYIVALTQSTRQGEGAEGASPRGTLSLLRASQGYALVQGRAYVVPEDIKEVAIPVLAHRIITDAVRTGEREDRIRMLLDKVPVPTEDWSAR
jgi:MoxR-like ATPase